jgi:hypothetical protein
MSLICLQFVGDNDIGSRLISWFSAGHLSHVDAVLPDGRLLGARSDKVGGAPPGVRIRPPDYVHFARKVALSMPATDSQMTAFYDFLQRQIGRPYDMSAIWGFVFGRDWRETDSWICSELQAAALEAAGVVPQLYLAANKITPVSLALAVSAIKGPA